MVQLKPMPDPGITVTINYTTVMKCLAI